MRRGSLYPLYADHCIAWTSMTEELFGYKASRAVAYFSNDTVFFRVCRDETLQGGMVLADRFMNNEQGFSSFRKYWTEVHEALRRWIAKTARYKTLDIATSVESIVEFSALNKKAQAVWSSKEYLDAYLSLHGFILQGKSFSNRDKEQIDSIKKEIMALEPTLYENYSIGSACENIAKANPDLCKLIADYCSEFAWTGASYSEVLEKDFSFFINSLFVRSDIQNSTDVQVAEITNRRVFPHGDIIFDLFEERKELMLKSFYRLHWIYEKVGAHYGLYANQAKWITPEEWREIASGNKTIEEDMVSERMYCSFIDCENGQIDWITGEDAYQKEFQFRKSYFNAESETVSGESVYHGTVRGRCIVMKDKITIPDDGQKYVFVTGMTTPDMIPYMDRALAVVTDEGGSTCHAAIMCREMKIICVVGTRFATKVFNDGDLVEVSNDLVTLIERTNSAPEARRIENRSVGCTQNKSLTPLPPQLIRLDEIDDSLKAKVGNKAFYCHWLGSNGFHVPQGFVIYGNTLDVASIAKLLPLVAKSDVLYAVRSSASNEDSHQSSQAGKYKTFLNVRCDELVDSIVKCAETILQNENGFSVLVQEMVNSKVSGVAFTSNVISSRYDLILVEADDGVAAVVDGNHSPQRYYVKKESGIVERIDINGTIEPRLQGGFVPKQYRHAMVKPKTLASLTEQLRKIENVFNYPCDVEWAIDSNGTIWLLQCRKIVRNN